MKRPKLRIKKVFVESLENIGKPLGQIMRENGYSDNMADNPQILTESKSWEMLLEQYLPDDLIALKTKEGLDAYTIKTSFTEPDQVIPDFSVRQRYIETALKMKGKITEKKELKIKSLKGLVSVNYGEKD